MFGEPILTTRRAFLTAAAATAAFAQWPGALWPQATNTSAELTLSIDPKRQFATMPRNFTGLSYESAQLGHPDFFSGDNRSLIALVKRLGAQGVLRIGGNTAEYTRWSGDDADAAKNLTPSVIGPDAGTAAETASILTPRAIRNLNAFMEATGWQLIYGLNLRHGTPENAAAEAKYVSEVLGSRLLAFQIGNEPDMNHAEGSKERWTFDEYWGRWQKFHDAVRQAVPSARFAGPDIAKELDWIAKMVAKRPDIDFLTGHHYAEGPPKDPRMTLEFLLRRGNDPATGEIALVQDATKALGKPYRMSEGNTCFHGGKPGVSDTFASALWSGDYMLQLAQAGYIGINLHGGGEGLYTPIAGSLEQGFSARPVYYGMLMAQRFAGATFVAASLSAQSEIQNVTAFAASHGHEWKLAIFNKASTPVRMKITGIESAKSKADVTLLQAPAIDSKDSVTLGGSTVSANGAFAPRPHATISIRRGNGNLELPAYTAAMIEL